MMTRGVTLPRNRRFAFSPSLTGSVAWSMPLGLMAGRPFKPFRRAISARCSATVFSSAATLPNSSTSSASSSGRLRSAKDGGGGTSTQNRTPSSRGKRKMSGYPRFCPSYEIPHRTAFAQELGVAVVGEAGTVTLPGFKLDDGDDPILGCSGRNCRAHDDDMRRGLLPQGPADDGGYLIDGVHRHAAVGRAGRADGDEREVGCGNCRG